MKLTPDLPESVIQILPVVEKTVLCLNLSLSLALNLFNNLLVELRKHAIKI